MLNRFKRKLAELKSKVALSSNSGAGTLLKLELDSDYVKRKTGRDTKTIQDLIKNQKLRDKHYAIDEKIMKEKRKKLKSLTKAKK
jgi:hypothetical protein|tara:strand:+ start:444 stop:698 length:255 start_codon:yes stop_codon:yes gene_type:complete